MLRILSHLAELAPFFGDLSQSEKLSEIKSPLILVKLIDFIQIPPCHLNFAWGHPTFPPDMPWLMSTS